VFIYAKSTNQLLKRNVLAFKICRLSGVCAFFSSMSTGQHGVNTAKGPSGPPGKPGLKVAQRNSTSLILYKKVKFNNTINQQRSVSHAVLITSELTKLEFQG